MHQTTEQELEYLAGLGTWRGPHSSVGKRPELLRRYIDTADDRSWEGMNKAECLKCAERILEGT